VPLIGFALWLQTNTAPAANGELPVGDTGYAMLLFRMILYLALICGAIWLVLRYLMPRVFRWRMPAGGAMTVVDRIPVGSGKTICVVRAVGRYYLIGVADSSVRLLTELDDKDVAAHYPSVSGRMEKGGQS